MFCNQTFEYYFYLFYDHQDQELQKERKEKTERGAFLIRDPRAQSHKYRGRADV